MIIEYAKNPIRNQNGTIDLVVKFKEFPVEVSFTASSDDVEEHGRIIFQNAESGFYGPVG